MCLLKSSQQRHKNCSRKIKEMEFVSACSKWFASCQTRIVYTVVTGVQWALTWCHKYLLRLNTGISSPTTLYGPRPAAAEWRPAATAALLPHSGPRNKSLALHHSPACMQSGYFWLWSTDPRGSFKNIHSKISDWRKSQNPHLRRIIHFVWSLVFCNQ